MSVRLLLPRPWSAREADGGWWRDDLDVRLEVGPLGTIAPTPGDTLVLAEGWRGTARREPGCVVVDVAFVLGLGFRVVLRGDRAAEAVADLAAARVVWPDEPRCLADLVSLDP